MDDQAKDVGSTPVPGAPVEGWMLGEDVVREVLARLARGEHVKTIARELGVDKKTIKRWRQRGAWRPRRPRVYPKAIDAHQAFLERRGPEVGWNGVVLLRELRAQGFTGGYQQVQRALQPLRTTRQWAARATVRFETGPSEQAQIDFGQLRVWIGDVETPVHFFVFTLGFSRRAVAYAYRNERLDTLLDGHERALRHFGGVPLSCLYDNPRTITLGRSAGQVLWHPRFEDFARYYGLPQKSRRQSFSDLTRVSARRHNANRQAVPPSRNHTLTIVTQGQTYERPALTRLNKASYSRWKVRALSTRSHAPRRPLAKGSSRLVSSPPGSGDTRCRS
jgi:transposase